MKKRFILALVINSFLAGALFVYADWTAPPATPPTCPITNPACNVPIHVGVAGQIKQGGLTVGASGPLGVGFAVLNGKVGIGTAAPTRKLEVSGADTGIRVTDTDPTGNAFIELNTNDGGLSLFQNIAGRTRIYVGGERMTFLNTGEVGIGDTTPTTKLDVAGDINTTGVYRIAGIAGIGADCPLGQTPSGITMAGGIVVAAGACTPIGGGGGTSPGGVNGNVQFNNGGVFGGVNNLFWDNTNSRLGVRDAAPAAALTVGAGSLFQITGTGLVHAPNGSFTAPAYSFVGDTNSGIYSGGTDILRLVTSGVDRMTIDAAGRVGVGNATPAYRLDVSGNARITGGLDVGSQRITSVATPIAGTDAVNKDYVDAQVVPGLISSTPVFQSPMITSAWTSVPTDRIIVAVNMNGSSNLNGGCRAEFSWDGGSTGTVTPVFQENTNVPVIPHIQSTPGFRIRFTTGSNALTCPGSAWYFYKTSF